MVYDFPKKMFSLIRAKRHEKIPDIVIAFEISSRFDTVFILKQRSHKQQFFDMQKYGKYHNVEKKFRRQCHRDG